MKVDGCFCKTWETFTGYEYSCKVPSCKMSLAVAMAVECDELQIPIFVLFCFVLYIWRIMKK